MSKNTRVIFRRVSNSGKHIRTRSLLGFIFDNIRILQPYSASISYDHVRRDYILHREEIGFVYSPKGNGRSALTWPCSSFDKRTRKISNYFYRTLLLPARKPKQIGDSGEKSRILNQSQKSMVRIAFARHFFFRTHYLRSFFPPPWENSRSISIPPRLTRISREFSPSSIRSRFFFFTKYVFLMDGTAPKLSDNSQTTTPIF